MQDGRAGASANGGKPMDQIERAALLDRYRSGTAAVDDALAGIAAPSSIARPRMTSAGRRARSSTTSPTARRWPTPACAASSPTRSPMIQGYDEPVWARRLHYDRPIEPSIAVMRAVRGVEPPAAGVADRRGVVTNRDAQRVRRVQRRGMGPDLRLAPARPRRADPAGARDLRRGAGRRQMARSAKRVTVPTGRKPTRSSTGRDIADAWATSCGWPRRTASSQRARTSAR